MKWVVCVVVLVALSGCPYGASLELPSYVKICSRSDPKFNECALKSGKDALPTIVKGDSDLKIPVLDPLLLEKVKISEGSGNVRFNLTLTKALVHGLRYADLTSISVDFDKRVVGVEIEIKGANLQLISSYRIAGQVLILAISGEDTMNLTMENVKAKFKTGYDIVKHADGLDYGKFKNSEIEFNITRAYFDFKNLFSNDKTLSKQTNDFLNENWWEVYNEVKPAVSEVVRTVILDTASKVFDKIPFDKIFAE